jgi:peroxiredoxin
LTLSGDWGIVLVNKGATFQIAAAACSHRQGQATDIEIGRRPPMHLRLLTGAALGLALIAVGCSKPADTAAASPAPAAPVAAASATAANDAVATAPAAAPAAESAATSAMAATPAATPAAAPAHDMSKMATPVSAPANPANNDIGGVKTPEKIKDFTLVDQHGKSHELYALKDAKAVVLIWQGVGCPITQQMTPGIKEVADKYGPKGVQFMMINSNIQDTPEMIKQEAESFDIKMPVLKDADQKVGLDVGVQRTAEVVVIDPKKNWKILYHGPLDDRLTYGRARAKPDNTWTTDVLDAMLAGKDVALTTRPADGCIVNFPTR